MSREGLTSLGGIVRVCQTCKKYAATKDSPWCSLECQEKACQSMKKGKVRE